MNPEDKYCENILDNLREGLYIMDTNRIITYWNKAAELITGFTGEEVIGSSCSDNILTHINGEGASLCSGECPAAEAIRKGCPIESQVYLHHKNGHRIPVSVYISPVKDSDGNITGAAELFSDLSNRTSQDMRIKELEKLVLLDGLTRLANRTYIERRLFIAYETYRRYRTSFGLLYIDIDNFKLINDQYGHDVGDEVLRFVAGTFVSNARPFDLYGRWGGDEFVAIIPDVDINDLCILGKRLLSLVENAYIIHEGIKVSVTISIGGTLINHDDNVKSLIKRADMLLYKSKSSGRNCLSID